MKLSEPLAEGAVGQVFPWGDDTVVKLARRWLLPEAVDHEYRVAHLLRAAGLNVPRALQRVEVEGRLGIVYTRASGPTMWSRITAAPHQALGLARTLGRLHAAVHGRLGPEELPDVHDRLRSRIESSPRAAPDVRELMLERLKALPRGDRLLHGDFHPGHVVMSRAGMVIVDWGEAARGHPLADVARTCFLIRVGGLPERFLPQLFVRACRNVFCRLYLRAYFQQSPYRQEDLRSWLILLMFVGRELV